MIDQKHDSIRRLLGCIFFTSKIIFTAAAPPDINSNQKEACTRNVLSGHCQLSNSTLVDTVYHIKLSRHTSSTIEDILTLSLDPPTNMTVSWHSNEFTNRASTDGSSIYPPRDAKLVFQLNPDFLKCDDSGMYKCNISGLSDTGKLFTEEITLHKNFTACTCSKAGQNNGHHGILASYVSIVMCQVFIIYMYKIF